MSKAYVIRNGDAPPGLPEGEEWYAMRLSLGIIGKGTFKRGVPKKFAPAFMLVATSRRAAMKEIGRLVDELFDAFDAADEAKKE